MLNKPTEQGGQMDGLGHTTKFDAPSIIKELTNGTQFVVKGETPATIPCTVILANISGKEATLEITDQNPWKKMEQIPELGIYVPGSKTSSNLWAVLNGQIFEIDDAKNMVPKILRSKN